MVAATATALVVGLVLLGWPAFVRADEAGGGQVEASASTTVAGPAAAAGAQAEPGEGPPRGPADIINRANALEAPEPMPRAAAPRAASPHGTGMMQAPQLATAQPDRLTPPGSIVVSVHDMRGMPVADADVQLGVMRSGGNREAQATRSDARGMAKFEGLDTGAVAAYRINLLYDGAKVSSTPFRLPEDTGYRVSITKVPTSRESRLVFQMIGQTVVELKDDRLHVTQQARLSNVGRQIYLFPEGGQFVPLPEGYISPQFQEVMTDQKLVEKPGEGFYVQGSLPPGTVTLAWGYDLPREGSEARIVAAVPWRTYMYRVLSDAPEGLELKVAGMPEPQRVVDQGHSLWITQVQHGPSDPPMQQVVLRLTGIPGPGPGRWVAVGFALLALGVAVWVAVKPGEGDALRRKLLGERKARLLDEVKQLDAQKEAGDVGPEFYQERLDALVDDLAVVLRDEQLLEQRG